MDIGEVLSRAWGIIWKHKVLWVFGLLSGCVAGNGGGGSQAANYTVSGNDLPNRFEQFFDGLYSLPQWQFSLIIAGIIVLALALLALMVLLGTIGRIGIIRGTMLVDRGESRLRFGELFRGGYPFFWRVFALNVLFTVIITLTTVLFAVVAAFSIAITLGIALVFIIPVLCVLVPIFWFLSVYLEQANAALVIEDIDVFEAFRRSWDVVKQNLGTLILMGLILGIGGAILSFILGLPFAMIMIPLVLGLATGESWGGQFGLGITLICLVIYLPVLLALAGAVRAYIGSVWALTYARLSGRTPAVIVPAQPAPVVSS